MLPLNLRACRKLQDQNPKQIDDDVDEASNDTLVSFAQPDSVNDSSEHLNKKSSTWIKEQTEKKI